ncbi:hypothetical protein BDN70DRAFT_800569 [Pholiota conissans]|uniref:BURP domain-containing protein n=1 Tax=Pholiota conissans TaxID=109636 RepID=A0A9P6D405_9AGAR|nr:hypothetical protein BDN70DRAFT_800569 [Pholiota conissans]
MIVDADTPRWCPVVLIVLDHKHNRRWDADAVGTFQEMNQRRREMGHPPLKHLVFPGVVIQASALVFYKVDVTQELATAVEDGVWPLMTTVMQRHIPRIPRPEKRVEEGMKPPDNRRVVLECYQALKGLRVYCSTYVPHSACHITVR